MKNLENYGVQEMSSKEIRYIDGGRAPKWIEFLGGPAWGLCQIYNYIEAKYEQGAACN